MTRASVLLSPWGQFPIPSSSGGFSLQYLVGAQLHDECGSASL